MLNKLRLAVSFSIPESAHPLVLLVVSFLAYGLLIPYLGLYWDDFPLAWIANQHGPEGLERYFSTNRPLWGLLYRVTTPLLGTSLPGWHVFAILGRWAAAVALWGVLRLLFPRPAHIAAWASLFFVVYPGFGQQFIALLYSHFFVILIAFILSLYFHILALRRRRYFWPFSSAALLLSAVNLLAMEYFFFLELLRPVLVAIALYEPQASRRGWLVSSLGHALPYLALFLAVGVWRAFFFPYQTQNYELQLLEHARSQPLSTLLLLAERIAGSLWVTIGAAWGLAFRLPDFENLGLRALVLFGLVSAGLTVLLAVYLARLPGPPLTLRKGLRTGAGAVLLGLLFCLAAGWPFWLIGFPPELVFPRDRFTLPFIIGASLVAAGVIHMLPGWLWSKALLAALVVGLSAGYQVQLASSYRQEWTAQKRLFWQMTWRMPDLLPGTTLLINELPMKHYTDNSLTAALNWIYDSNNPSQQMGYMLYYPTLRLGSGLPAYASNLPIQQDYLAASFRGSTSQMVALYYSPPGCLRVLEPELDTYNNTLPEAMKRAAAHSSLAPILPEAAPGKVRLPVDLYGQEPARDWCYYFQHADLARQQKDWEKVGALGDIALALDDRPNHPAERVPFIEGYAHLGRWEQSREQSLLSAASAPGYEKTLCILWNRISREVPGGAEKQEAVRTIKAELGCQP
jgi:hypothetical protein